jgi:hypothetical protein
MLLVVQFAILNGSGLSVFKYVAYFVSNEVLHQELKKFLELENLRLKKPLTIEERKVEPFKSEIENLVTSKELALKLYLNLEKKMKQ